jgi:predicted nucleotidyltransferase component of viral defense system
MDKTYINTVRLLLEVAPSIFKSEHFAIKGGTALNLFLQDMPRLSVDIDVVYTDHSKDRKQATSRIAEALKVADVELSQLGFQSELSMTNGAEESKLFIRKGQVLVKVEVNHVFRGTVLPVIKQTLSEKACNLFTTELTLPMLQADELYGSKLVAALDRQHPRDLFDMRILQLSHELPEQLMDCFVCYIAGHNRPIHEVIFSRDMDISMAYHSEFQGMTNDPMPLDDLLETRRWIRESLVPSLSVEHKRFSS